MANLKVVEAFVITEIIQDIPVGEGFQQKIMDKNDRRTHANILIDIIEAGCSAQGVNMKLIRKGRITHSTLGEIEILIW